MIRYCRTNQKLIRKFKYLAHPFFREVCEELWKHAFMDLSSLKEAIFRFSQHVGPTGLGLVNLPWKLAVRPNYLIIDLNTAVISKLCLHNNKDIQNTKYYMTMKKQGTTKSYSSILRVHCIKCKLNRVQGYTILLQRSLILSSSILWLTASFTQPNANPTPTTSSIMNSRLPHATVCSRNYKPSPTSKKQKSGPLNLSQDLELSPNNPPSKNNCYLGSQQMQERWMFPLNFHIS